MGMDSDHGMGEVSRSQRDKSNRNGLEEGGCGQWELSEKNLKDIKSECVWEEIK